MKALKKITQQNLWYENKLLSAIKLRNFQTHTHTQLQCETL